MRIQRGDVYDVPSTAPSLYYVGGISGSYKGETGLSCWPAGAPSQRGPALPWVSSQTASHPETPQPQQGLTAFPGAQGRSAALQSELGSRLTGPLPAARSGHIA